MTPSAARSVARCEDCSKAYRVPNPDRAYACKACGGVVRRIEGLAPAPEDGVEGLVLCNDCQTLSPLGAQACPECGADLAGATVVEDEEQAADLLEEAKEAFRRAGRWSGAVAWTYHGGAVAYAVAALLAVLALAEPDVPVGGGVAVVALTVFLSVLMGTAALHLLFQPFLWTLSVALLATGVAAVHALGPNPLGVGLLGSGAWALLSWALLFPVKELQTWIHRHKDLYILHHASQQTKQSLRGRTPGERHARLLRAMQRADRRAWKVSAAAGVVLVLASAVGTYGVVTGKRPGRFDAALEAFEVAWNAGDAEGIRPLFDPRVREAEGTWLGAVISGHGWGDGLPALPEGTLREGEGERYVDYELEEFPLTARFVLNDLEWWLARVELPYPSIQPALARFRSAWDGGATETLAAFFAPERRDEVLEQLDATRTRRGWDAFPPVLETTLQGEGDRRVSVVMNVGKRQDLRTAWFFHDDGTWGVVGLTMPTIWHRRDDGGGE